MSSASTSNGTDVLAKILHGFINVNNEDQRFIGETTEQREQSISPINDQILYNSLMIEERKEREETPSLQLGGIGQDYEEEMKRRAFKRKNDNKTKSVESNCSTSSSFSKRRSVGSKSLLTAATTAALMAPSPLGQVPSIPGVIAVAVSPAAQLFREDDWSWHRNPAAAIRSGGTNKQTPVWKYFVYNKAENLSRCIVGNCTYQLKGPHTSTLACHLKKHCAEFAEFQRFKSEYTRERIASGHGQALANIRETTECVGSSCSTPGSVSSIFPFSVQNVDIETKSDQNINYFNQKSLCGHSPSPSSTTPSPIKQNNSDDQIKIKQEQQQKEFYEQQQTNGGSFCNTLNSNNGCFPQGLTLMMAAMGASQQQQKTKNSDYSNQHLPIQSNTNNLSYLNTTTNYSSLNKDNKGGINLLNILNMLNKKNFNNNWNLKNYNCENNKKLDKQNFEKVENEERCHQTSPNQTKHSCIKEEESEEINFDNRQNRQQCSTARIHFVEHLLGTNNIEESQAILNKNKGINKLEKETCSSNDKQQEIDTTIDIEKLILSLGTTFSRSELIKLLNNPFIKGFTEWTIERIDKILDKHFLLVKEKICENLHLDSTTQFSELNTIPEILCINGKNNEIGEIEDEEKWLKRSVVLLHSSNLI